MTRAILCLGLVHVLALAFAGNAHAQGRSALVVSNRFGATDEAPLRFPGEDATRLTNVLEELGGFSAERVRGLAEPTPKDVLARLAEQSHAAPGELFLFYYSGHAGADGLHLGNAVLPFDALVHAVEAVPARLHVLLLDGCESGAAARAKGVRRDEPIEVRAEVSNVSGTVVVSSSSESERSFESDSAKGALFTLAWVSGLRGAADADGDAQVTLSEAFRYAYARTLRDTLLARGGPQRPTFRWALAGSEDPVLTRLNQRTQVELVAREAGTFWLFDESESHVVAETWLEAGEHPTLSLAPGVYVARKRGNRDVRSARFAVREGARYVLDERQMPGAPLLRLARKGGRAPLSLDVSVGLLTDNLSGSLISPYAAVGLNAEVGAWLLGGELGGGGVKAPFLGPDDVLRNADVGFGQAMVHALPGLRAAFFTLRIGPELGLRVLRQMPEEYVARTSVSLLAGGQVRAEVDLTDNLLVFATVQADALYGPDVSEAAARTTTELSITMRAGLRAYF